MCWRFWQRFRSSRGGRLLPFILVLNVWFVNKTLFSVCEGVLSFDIKLFGEIRSTESGFVSLFKFIGEIYSVWRYDEIAFLIWITLNPCFVQTSSSGWIMLTSESFNIIWLWGSRDVSNLLKVLLVSENLSTKVSLKCLK